MGKSFNDSAITRILLSHRFADGGSMDSDKSDRPISQQRRDVRGVTEFNAGGSHEENPYGGVPQGIAPDGAPNLVEQGEVKLSDIIGQDNQYVLSNRIMVDAEHARQFNIPDSVVGMTYAAAFKKLYQPLKERNGNIEVKNEIAHLANAFMQAQDSIKAEQEAQQASAIMQALPPEAQQQVMQAAMGQQQGGQPSPQDQQAMQQQQMMEQQQDPSMMGGQQMPPEAMMQQEGQPSPEEMAMMQQQRAAQQQDPNAIAAQQPMMARGGKLYNQFSKGGNMKFNNNMFGGVFAHKFDEGGNMGTSRSGVPIRVLDTDDGVITWQRGDKTYRTALSAIESHKNENDDFAVLSNLLKTNRPSAQQTYEDNYYPKYNGQSLDDIESRSYDDGVTEVRRGRNGTWVSANAVGRDMNLSKEGRNTWFKDYKDEQGRLYPVDNIFNDGEYAPNGVGFARHVNATGRAVGTPELSQEDVAVLRHYVKNNLKDDQGSTSPKTQNQSQSSAFKVLDTNGDQILVQTSNGEQRWYSKHNIDNARMTTPDASKAAEFKRVLEQANQMRQAKAQSVSVSATLQKDNASPKRTASQSKSESSDKKNASTEDKSIEELANMAIRGKLGNGKARKEALGDKHAAVQKLVNEKMAASKAKKAKVKDERGGTKEVEIPSWVGKPDDLDKPIESKEPQVSTSDLGLSNLSPKGLSSPYQNEEYPFLEDESEFDRLLRRMHRQTAGL